MPKNPLRGDGEQLHWMIQNLIDTFLEDFPETPIQTVHLALIRLAKEYDPAEEESDH